MMLDTAVQQNSRDMVLKVLAFGTKKLFEKTEENKQQVNREYQVDMDTLEVVLNRKA